MERRFEGVFVGQLARTGVVAGQLQRTFASVDALRCCRRECRQLSHRQGAGAHGDASQPVRRCDLDDARGSFAARPVNQTAFINGGLPGHAVVSVHRGDAGRTIRMAIDGDRQCCRAGIAIRVGNGVGEGFGQVFPVLQGIHRCVAVVQGVGVAAVRIQNQRAVGARHAAWNAICNGCCLCPRLHLRGRRRIRAQRIRDFRMTAGPGNDIAAHDGGQCVAVVIARLIRPVFGHRYRVVLGRRRRVGDIDGQRAIRFIPAVVFGADENMVKYIAGRMVFARTGRVVAVTDLPRRGVVTREGQDALIRGDIHWRRCGERSELRRCQRCSSRYQPPYRDAHQTVRGTDSKPTGGGLVFPNAVLTGDIAVGIRNSYTDAVVGAGHRYHQRCRTGIAIGVGDGVTEGVGCRLSCIERLHRGLAVVQRVDVGPVRVQYQRAIDTGDRCADVAGGRYWRPCRDARYCRRIRPQGICTRSGGNDVTAHRVRARIFCDRRRVRFGRRRTVYDVDNEHARANTAAQIGHAQGDVIQGMRRARLVERGLQGIGVAQIARCSVISGQRQRPLDGVDALWCRSERRQLRRAQRDTPDGDAGETVRGADLDNTHRRFAGIRNAGQPLLIDRGVTFRSTIAVHRGDGRRPVGMPIYRDCQCCRAGIAVRVGNGVGEGLG